MPTCKCGLKVDRHKKYLECDLCHHFFHLGCCNITEVEFEFTKKQPFKYKACLTARRSPSIVQPLSDMDVTVNEAVSVTGNTDAPFSQADAIPLPNSSVECVPSLDIATQSTLPISGVTLELIFAELISLKESNAELRASNESLTELVSCMREYNSKLVATVHDLRCSFDKLKDSVNLLVNASPKRKKRCIANSAPTAENSVLFLPANPDNTISKPASTIEMATTPSHVPATVSGISSVTIRTVLHRTVLYLNALFFKNYLLKNNINMFCFSKSVLFLSCIYAKLISTWQYLMIL